MSLRKAVAVLVVAMLVGCGPSTEDVSNSVKDSVQQTLSTDPAYRDYKLNVKSVTVVHETDGRYQGMVYVDLDGEEYSFPVNITADRKNMMWRSEPGAFAFVLQHQLSKSARKPSAANTAQSPLPPSATNAEWSVHLASLSNRSNADKLASSLKSYGFDAYILSAQNMNRVFVGPYERQQADAVRDQLHSQQKLDGFVVRYVKEPQ